MTRSRARIAALVLGGLLLVGALVVLLTGGGPAAFPLAFWGVVIVAAVAFERWRYKPMLSAPGPGFEATPERFIDPASGRPVQVFVDSKSGERRYVQG
ncbi:hypothetical protein BH09PSE2_BH09PSE2_24620 [soil metagenome]